MVKAGRPKLDEPRDQRVTIRFTDAEMKRLTEYAKKNSLKLSETIRKSLNNIINQEGK